MYLHLSSINGYPDGYNSMNRVYITMNSLNKKRFKAIFR